MDEKYIKEWIIDSDTEPTLHIDLKEQRLISRI